jgi:hypothetical protein
MRESDTYMAIIEEGIEKGIAMGIEKGVGMGIEKGRLEEARKMILRIGHKRLGPPEEAVKSDLAGISSSERLELLLERVIEVASWRELLATP